MKKGSLFLLILGLIIFSSLVIAPAPPIDCSNTPNNPFCLGGIPADCDLAQNNPICWGLEVKGRGQNSIIAYDSVSKTYFSLGEKIAERNGTLNSENNWFNNTHMPIIICEAKKTPYEVCKDEFVERKGGIPIDLEKIPVYNLKEVEAPKWLKG